MISLPRHTASMLAQRIIFLGTLLLSAAAFGAAGPAVMLEGTFEDVAQDGAGIVWAISKDRLGEISTLDGTRWMAQQLPGLKGRSRGVQLCGLGGGDVMGLWQEREESGTWFYTFHRAKQTKDGHGVFKAELHEPRLWASSDASALLTEKGPALIRFKADHSTAEVITIPDRFFVEASNRPSAREPYVYVPIRAVEDGNHGWWLWSAEGTHHGLYGSLTGLVHLAASGQPSEPIPVNGRKPITAVVRWDEKHLAVAVLGTGLLLVDVAHPSLPPVPVPEPEKDAFLNVEQIFKAGGEWHVVTTPAIQAISGFVHDVTAGVDVGPIFVWHSPGKPVDTLWKNDHGQWRALQRGLDETTLDRGPVFGHVRLWMMSAEGLVLARQNEDITSERHDPWVFPNTGEPSFRLSLEMGFPMERVSRLCAADAGHLLFLGAGGQTWLWPTALQQGQAPPVTFDRIKVKNRMLPDSRGHLWCIHTDHTFAEWDGEKWTAWPLPPEALKCAIFRFVGDDHDQGWFLPEYNGPAAILDFKTGQWRTFSTLRLALEAQLPHGVKFDFPENRVHQHAFSGDGRIGGFLVHDKLSLFENGRWREFESRFITGNAAVNEAPYFAPDGAFVVPTMQATYQWQEATGWTKADNRPHSPESYTFEMGPTIKLQSGRVIREFPHLKAARDVLGAVWFFGEGKELRKFMRDREVSVFPPGMVSPFRDRPLMERVLVDARGGAFMDTEPYYQERVYLHIPPRLPIPQTEMDVTPLSLDKVRVNLRNKAGGETWYTWHLDDGDWEPLQQKPEIHLEAVPKGEHHIEVRAWNAALEPEFKSVTATFQSTPKEDSLIARLITGDSGNREDIVRSLVRFGPSVLPKIKAAREKAPTSTAQWWLDAAAQQIERQETPPSATKEKPGN